MFDDWGRRRMTVDELLDGWEAAWSGKDPDAFGEVCRTRSTTRTRSATSRSRASTRWPAHAERLWAGFPDARLERTGERLTAAASSRRPCKLLGTHRAPLEGLPATNRFVVVHCVFYCELEHDQLCGSAPSSTSTTPPSSSACCRRGARSARRRCSSSAGSASAPPAAAPPNPAARPPAVPAARPARGPRRPPRPRPRCTAPRTATPRRPRTAAPRRPRPASSPRRPRPRRPRARVDAI